MQTQHIAIVPEVAGINASELARVSAALQKQIIRDLSPIWEISATVDAFPHLEDVPVGYWPIIIAFGELGGDEGVHCDRKGQPYALIEMSASWSLTASHVCIEMLIDPYGNRTVVGPSPRSDQGSVEFLVDICDPCEDARYAYTVNDVLVSDFCTPEFLAQIPSGKERYSFTGAIEAPYQVLPGGRLSWYDPASNRWWQRNHSGGAARDTDLGFIERRAGRGFSVNHPRAPRHLQATKLTLEAFESRMGIQRQRALHASQSQAHLLRVHLGNPGGVGNLAIDATGGSPLDHGSVLSNRPQVLAALIKSSAAGVNSGDAPSPRRRSLADSDHRAVVGAPIRAGQRTLQSGGLADPTGFEQVENTSGMHSAKAPPLPSQAPEPPRFDEDDRYVGAEAFAEPQARREVERRAHSARSSQARSAQRPEDARRTTIPPPLPRTASPAAVARSVRHPEPAIGHNGRTSSRVGPSLPPTATNVGAPPSRSSSSTRDRVLLAVGAASLAVLGIYWIGGTPASTPATAASGSMIGMAAPLALTPAVSSAAPDSSAGTSGAAVAGAPASAPPPAHPAAARAPKGPRPKMAAGGTNKQAAWSNPYDSPPVVEPLDQLVEERR